ncbi:MAG TPA: hypothetical protein VN605_06410 [Thermoanaerobaculia bacterium]|nr:hypothetical protein [Thermoanaerobaculia bacterium]
MSGAQFVPYLDDTVEWRGHPMRIGRNTVLTSLRSAPTQSAL